MDGWVVSENVLRFLGTLGMDEGLSSLSQEKLCLSPNRFSVLSVFSVPALLNKPAM